MKRTPKNAIEAVRHSYYPDWTETPPVKPTSARSGTEEKVRVMAQRLERGESAFSEHDSDQIPASSIAAAMYAEHDLARDQSHRRWRLQKAIVLRIDDTQGMEVHVDRVEITGCAVAIHAVELHQWLPLRHVMWSVCDEGPEVLLLAVASSQAIIEYD